MINSPKNRSRILVYGIFVTILLVCVDFFVKKWVMHNTDISYLCNAGIAFGIMIHQYFFVVLWAVITGLLGILWWSKRHQGWKTHIPFVMIFAGAVGNMIDRILYGCVIDYIPFFTISSFNLADMLISAGAILLLFNNWNNQRHD